MRRRRLLWQLFASYLIITLLALMAVGWFSLRSIEQFYLDSVRNDLEVRCELLRRRIAESFTTDDAGELARIVDDFGQTTDTRVTIIRASGEVLADSREAASRMENHADRPEIAEALAGRIGSSTRYSTTLAERMMYVAVPIEPGEHQPRGAVRTAVSVARVDETLSSIQMKVLLAGLVIALFAAGVSLVVSRRTAAPLEQIGRAAQRFAAGELDYRLPIPEQRESAALAESLNSMAQQLQERIDAITRQTSEQDTVLGSMVEGVLAIDRTGRVISLNASAAKLLGLRRETALGRRIDEIVLDAELREFADRALRSDEPVRRDLNFHAGAERIIEARGSALEDPHAPQRRGVVIMLNDVTNVRRLETMRRDFVANVSHELKTPIATIKGFVETLLDGAMDEREEATRFLNIIARQSDRLAAIIEDLLSLAKIEQSERTVELEMRRQPIRPVLESAIAICQPQAQESEVAVELTASGDLIGEIDAALLEQAITNLLDNAVKYSKPGGKVTVSAAAVAGDILLTVRDEGVGIAAEHLPRLFERFYRVDKARSRKLGGTGLGLAIVKHIAQAHRGRIEVESRPGRGSAFTIRLPHPRAASVEASGGASRPAPNSSGR